ncbi:MAG TPA: hypothetical protein VE173_16335 [Longimicrobiales bacterium]|nr:hypothetical protein [Longimicrobiales bacterium]
MPEPRTRPRSLLAVAVRILSRFFGGRIGPSREGALCRVAGSLAVAAALALALGGCEDGTGPAAPRADTLGVVLNSVDLSLTLFDAASPTSSAPVTVGLAPDGSPVSLAVRGSLAAVPLGTVPAVAVVDLETASLLRTISLPEGSGATGVAFLDDSTTVVANPGRNTVSPVDLRDGTVGAEVPVGGYPQGVVVAGERVVVVNGELGPDFQPAGPGTLTVLDRATLAMEGSVTLSGENPGSAVVAPGGRLYVVLSGTFGAGDGSLSVVDLGLLEETAHHPGFGEFPFAAALGPAGRLYVASFAYGVAVWDPASETFVRSPDDAVTPGGIPSVSGLAFDPRGRLHALRPDCQAPGAVLRLSDRFTVDAMVPVGTCPIAIGFTTPSG